MATPTPSADAAAAAGSGAAFGSGSADVMTARAAYEMQLANAQDAVRAIEQGYKSLSEVYARHLAVENARSDSILRDLVRELADEKSVSAGLSTLLDQEREKHTSASHMGAELAAKLAQAADEITRVTAQRDGLMTALTAFRSSFDASLPVLQQIYGINPAFSTAVDAYKLLASRVDVVRETDGDGTAPAAAAAPAATAPATPAPAAATAAAVAVALASPTASASLSRSASPARTVSSGSAAWPPKA